ncbi:uncharacterized protein C8A04DRAFT_12739 [Dichotomopilus funicola]|uniref:histidine kinase n=1 Tax=Dichotomopilus funicola TaxID=1934379 RepID=A0AAN6ZMF6_9PEZI|nr:hypothetical protein C8A04DRAFT_12739 [Dichotomopilus funicola]
MSGGPVNREEGTPPSSGPSPTAPAAIKKSISFKDDPEYAPSVRRSDIPAAAQADGHGPSRDSPQSGVALRGERGASSLNARTELAEAGGDAEAETEPAKDSQRRLDEYRENLARQMGRRELPVRGGQPTGLGPARVSPILEENSPSSLPRSTGSSTEPLNTLATNASTGSSNHTIRGAPTPTPGVVAATPSYPFPRMTPPSFLTQGVHRPFTTLSPTIPPDGIRPMSEIFKGQDTLVSNLSTPASTMTFLPPGCHSAALEPSDFPSPNLYELSLMLAAEPGLDAWWDTVVQIMVDVYRAERVTLAIPADSTDIENVPWGQKATYNAHREDDLSVGYLARGSSFQLSSTDNTSERFFQPPETPGWPGPPTRPSLQSRHSFTSYEENRKSAAGSGERTFPSLRRPNTLLRSKSHHPSLAIPGYKSGNDDNDDESGGRDGDDSQTTSLNQEALEQHDALEEEQHQQQQQDIPSWEAPFSAPREGHGKVLNVLQALDYEADPLIDHNGVLRILDRGRVVALTRSYPYLNQDPTGKKQPSSHDSRGGLSTSPTSSRSPEGARKKGRRPRSDSLSKLTSMLGGGSALSPAVPAGGGRMSQQRPPILERKSTFASRAEDESLPSAKKPSPTYEEYEQAPPSPWSQSPAPSPAVRADPAENPFFADAVVDEESFNPSSAPTDYSAMVPPEAIGMDNAWTVLHIPLTHVLLSRPNPSFKLDPAAMEQKISARKTGDPSGASVPSPERPAKEKHAPIAILSILSPIIPYPSNLRHSLEHLAPHLATSFSLCRHYSNLETELSGLQKRRPHTAGFGALGPDGRPLADPTALASFAYLPSEADYSRDSVAGSMTSPSEYSGPARSSTNSPGGTPSHDMSSLGLVLDPANNSSNKRPPTSSPAPVTADSYFGPMSTRASTTTAAGGTAIAGPRPRGNSRDTPPTPGGEKRSSLWLSTAKSQQQLPDSSAAASPTTVETARTSIDSGRQQESEDGISLPSIVTPSQQQPIEKSSSGSSLYEVHADAYNKQSLNAAAAATGGTVTPHRHTKLHSYGADFASTFQSLPPSSTIGRGIPRPAAPSRTGSIVPSDMTPPSDKLKGLILDSLPAHVFVALPQTGEIVWVNSRFLTYRGQTSGDLAADPWGSIHPHHREKYLHKWSQCVRTGEQFAERVMIRRFDGEYRWFYARAVASKDKRGVILQFLGSYMDIHEQQIAEDKARDQEKTAESEAKHRLLANLIPQIIFTATEEGGITFANDQWKSYTDQDVDSVLGLGFMDYVHPDDLAKCRIPLSSRNSSGGQQQNLTTTNSLEPRTQFKNHGRSLSADFTATRQSAKHLSVPLTPTTAASHAAQHSPLARNDSSSSSGSGSGIHDGCHYDLPTANLTELARKGVIKVSTDSSGRLSYTTEIRLRSKTGEYRWHLIRCVETGNVNFGNWASSYFGSATDINDLKLLETKLKEAMDSKGRFLSNMSHEIRTPLIGISGMVSFLQDTTLNEEQRDYTNTIQTSANSLLMIINDILDLSKVDAGMMKLNYEWFHTRSLIEDVNELVSTMAIAKRLELNYVVEEDVPAFVKGDKVRIRQVLLNVIGNAIKFTSKGEVFSKVRVVRPDNNNPEPRDDKEKDDDQIMLEFSIIDTGRGFTKEEADLIFKPFSQIDGSSTRQHGGSGLGLVISRQLAELHGGTMVGTAVPGKGSTFTFTARFGLPTEVDHPDMPAPTPAATTTATTTTTMGTMPMVPVHPPAVAALRATGSDNFGTAGISSTGTVTSPPTAASSGSSNFSESSTRSRATDRSSVSSVNAGLVRFSQAARASGQDLSQMKLEMPHHHHHHRPGTSTPTDHELERQKDQKGDGGEKQHSRYSILIICPQNHSREATRRHIEMTLPKNTPHQIKAVASVDEADSFLHGDDAIHPTHIVANLPSPEEIVSLMDKILSSSTAAPPPSISSDPGGGGSGSSCTALADARLLMLSDSVQRQAVTKLVAGTKYEDALTNSDRVTYIYKPVKPSRFAVIFDPAKERDLSIDHNRSTAQRLVEDQRQSYVDMERRMGGKGYKVLLVEDNPVNQKVLKKYLKRVGVEVELAADGVECTEMVFGKGWGYYSLILCDLHMPRKDGYQACREVRAWEAQQLQKEKAQDKAQDHYRPLPIIALSANVMSDVQEKCVEAGFNDYVTKPVDFIDLSRALGKFF